MNEAFPALPYEGWRDTLDTLHRWTQVIGKVQLALTPTLNHFWNVALRVTPSGLATGAMPFGWQTLQITFDFHSDELVFRTSRGDLRALPLRAQSVASFYREVMHTLDDLGVPVHIREQPSELLVDAIPFSEDELHRTFHKDAAWRCWRVLASSAIVMEEFRARFSGKASPVHFFWGSFDLAATRYGGRPAELSPGADAITRESYREECMSVGFWPGDVRLPMPAYYAYAVPRPDGFESARVLPAAASWDPRLGEFILPYDAVRLSNTPRTMLLDFFQSTYEAGATLAGWDRARLEQAAPDHRVGAPPSSPREQLDEPTAESWQPEG